MTALVPAILLPGTMLSREDQQRLADALAVLWSRLESAHSRRAYDSDWRHYIAYLAGRGVDPLRAGSLEILGFLSSLTNGKGEPAARATRARTLSTLRQIYSAAYRAGLCPGNPAREVKLPRAHREPRTPWLTVAELVAMLTAAGDSWVARRDRLVLLMLLGLGLRRSSVAGILVCDLIRRSDGRLAIHVHAKGRKEADLLVPLWLAREIESWIAFSNITGPLFPRLRRIGYDDVRPEMMQPIGPGKVRDIVVAAAQRSGVDPTRATPHAIRRSYVTIARERGVAIDDLQLALMHEDRATTEAYDKSPRSMKTAPGDVLADIVEFGNGTKEPGR